MKSYKKFILSIILFISFAIIFSFNIDTTAASQSGIYVSPSGHDTWDGQSPTWTGKHGPKKTIKNAVGTVSSGGTIQIASGTYHEYDIDISKSMKINGASKKTTLINALYKGNIFTIASGVNVTISNLRIDRGKSNTNNVLHNDYGAIHNAGRTTLINTSFTNNQAPNGGAIYNIQGYVNIIGSSFINNSVNSGYGGAIYNQASATINNCLFSYNKAINGGGSVFNIGLVNIYNSNFTNNHVAAGGGAIRNARGTVTIKNCNFIGNNVNGGGGAIFNIASNKLNPSSSTIIITNSKFSNNIASNGGSLDNYYGKLIVNSCSFTSNYASSKGGAIVNYYGVLIATNIYASFNKAYKFGGVLFSCGPVTISKSQFKNNRVTNGSGGVIYNFDDDVNVSSCTFTGNSAGGLGIDDQGYSGCIHVYLGTVSINTCSFTGNTATTAGGVIVNDDGSILNIKNSIFTKNSATSKGPYGNGGVIFTLGNKASVVTTVSVYNSTFIGNSANSGGRGGGVITAMSTSTNDHCISTFDKCKFYNNTATYGGAIQTQFGTFTVTNSIFNGNTASYDGGAIYTIRGLTTIEYNNITNNKALNRGSAIYNSGHDIFVHHNNIETNPGSSQIRSPNNNQYTPPTKYCVYAQENWWGSNNDPSNYVSIAGNSVLIDNWLSSPQT